AAAPDPDGGKCFYRNTFECGILEGYNNGNRFVFYCQTNNTLQVVEFCSCPTCCDIVNGGVGNGGSINCY
ncbi:hypothetical protein K503DRAFT_773066, partial [Rhizopogon vinicolor AM-OR11-026]